MGWLKKKLRHNLRHPFPIKNLVKDVRKVIHAYRHRNDYEDLSRGLSRRQLVGKTGFSRYVTPLAVHGGKTSARQVVGNTNFTRFGYG